MKFGASIWPFQWDPPYEDGVRRIGRLGFRAVELIAWNLDVLENYYTPSRIRDLRSLIDGEGLTLSQFVGKPGILASGDATERACAVDDFKRYADTAVALGADIINGVPDFPFGINFPKLIERPVMQEFTVDVPAGLDWDRNWIDYVDAIRACSEYAASVGLRFTLEPHPFRYGASIQGILRLIDAVDSPALGVNFDPSHLFAVGEIPHVGILQLGKRLFHCHFSDNDGETNAHWRPGAGKIDWRRIFLALREVGFDGTISLEFEDVPGVSRSERHVRPGEYVGAAGPQFETENAIALGYLTDLAREVGLTVE